jgi:hypothetical protein
MKYLTILIITTVLSATAVAKEDTRQIDLEFKSLSYSNDLIPTLRLDLSSKELRRLDFIVAFASNYFELRQPLIDLEKREHIYLGLNYKF